MLYTFYSYKGGVGRSMALANIGMHLYRRPLNVILVDWDLEAPGLEQYFAERYPDLAMDEVRRHVGLCDLVARYKDTISQPPPEGEPDPSPFPDLDDFLVTLEEGNGCCLRLLTAGDRSDWPRYASFVQNFNWSDFYENWSGGALVDWLHDELCEQADVVLVDSRTGITEIGGVTTHQLADAIVMPFAPNEENMVSSARMAEGFMSEQTAKERGRPLPVIFVPSRVDSQDSTEYSSFVSRLLWNIVPLVPAELREDAGLDEVTIPYASAISFRERLIFGDEELEKRFHGICDAYVAIASNMRRLAPEDSWLRAGSRAVAGRKVMLLGGGPRSRAEIQELLVASGFDVMGDDAFGYGSTAFDGDPASDMSSVTCVIALIDGKTDRSRVFSRTIAVAERHEKPIIPVLLEPGVEVPDVLAHRQAMSWGRDDSVSGLLQAIEITARRRTRDRSDLAPRIFVSYAHRDRLFAKALMAHLRSKGLDGGDAETVLVPGAEWSRVIVDAIRAADAMVAVLSASAGESPAVSREIVLASDLGKTVVPVATDHTRPTGDLAYWLAGVQQIDLSDFDPSQDDLDDFPAAHDLVTFLRRHASGQRPDAAPR